VYSVTCSIQSVECLDFTVAGALFTLAPTAGLVFAISGGLGGGVNLMGQCYPICASEVSVQVPGQTSFPGGKDSSCTGLTTLPPSRADCLGILEPQPPGTPRAFPGL
jgi:hypothetical protein